MSSADATRLRHSRILDLIAGFPLENPPILIRWSTLPFQLQLTLATRGLKRIAANHYVLPDATSLGGLPHWIGFFFGLRRDEPLQRITLYQHPSGTSVTAEGEAMAHWHRFQKHLLAVFGAPLRSAEGIDSGSVHRWELPGGCIENTFRDRHGGEHFVSIRPAR